VSLPAGLRAYRALTTLLSPVVPFLLSRRARRGKEERERLNERLGRPEAARPDGPLVWLHGASVGETLVLLTLIEALGESRPDLNFLVTSGTTTSARIMAKRLPETARHQYLPVDTVAAATRFLDHWDPDLAIFAESELWPNLILETARRGAPMALVNARMNEKSLRQWKKRGASGRWLLACFDWIGAADQRTADGLGAIREEPVALAGNLKLEARPAAPEAESLAAALGVLGERPVWLAASTHEGEEGVAIAGHQYLLGRDKSVLLILAPRHPERGDAVAAMLEERGLAFARRSLGETPDAGDQVWLADTLGEMPLWFALSSAAFIGGSLVNGIGGHNPIEASRAGAPVITGKFTGSFDDVYAAYDQEKARVVVDDALTLSEAVTAAWEGGHPPVERAEKAIERASGGALETTLTALAPLLPEAGS
jgi:3-deoxy-D-manno-octulosonic-acid transferase